MQLSTYKPVNPESEVFLKNLSDFMDDARRRIEEVNQNHTHRLYYKFTHTLVPPAQCKRYDLHNWGEEILYQLHKLWVPNYRNRNVFLQFCSNELQSSIGYDVVFGIGARIIVNADGTFFMAYKLAANGVVMTVEYGVMDLCLADGEWITDNGVRISFSME